MLDIALHRRASSFVVMARQETQDGLSVDVSSECVAGVTFAHNRLRLFGTTMPLPYKLGRANNSLTDPPRGHRRFNKLSSQEIEWWLRVTKEQGTGMGLSRGYTASGAKHFRKLCKVYF